MGDITWPTLQFEVYGPPVGKQRARVTKRGVFTPLKTKAFERSVKDRCRLAVHEFGVERGYEWPKHATYALVVRAYHGDRRRRDVDNVAKAVMDAMNGVGYDDDSQVTALLTWKQR